MNGDPPAKAPVPPQVIDAALRHWGDSARQMTFTMSGESMLPFLVADDRLLIDHGWGNVRVGGLVAYRQGDTLVVHRLLRIIERDGEKVLLLRGDNNPHPDPLIPADRLVGSARLVRRGEKIVRVDTFVMRAVSVLIAAFARWPITAESFVRRSGLAGRLGIDLAPAQRAILRFFALPGRALSGLAWRLARDER